MNENEMEPTTTHNFLCNHRRNENPKQLSRREKISEKGKEQKIQILLHRFSLDVLQPS
jgi:hypothetical protein